MTPLRTAAAPLALVTGAGGSIGAAVATALAADGRHRVAVADLDLAAAQRSAARLTGGGAEAVAIELDVGSEASWGRALAAVGRVAVLVNAAGVEGPIAPLAGYSVDDFDAVLRVNLRGPFLGMRAVLPSMAHAKTGSIINIASAGGLVGVAGMGAYVASKHALVGLTRTAAIEYGSRGVRVNAVCPGPTEGRMMESIERGRGEARAARTRDAFVEAIPLRRYADPKEVAAAVAFLASDAANFVTGAALAVDGGMTAL